MGHNKKISDSILFPISEMNRSITDSILSMPEPSKWPALQSVRHLNRAWKIKDIDPEMALFRSITAEEEAATAVFNSLKRRHYQGADKLKPHSHLHKNAVIPFYDAITRVFTKIQGNHPRTHLELDTNTTPSILKICIEIADPISGEKIWGYPHPPLHFSVAGGPADREPVLEDFSIGIKELTDSKNVKDITEYLKHRANQRNQLLYARANGYPTFGGNIDMALEQYQRNVFILLKMYFFIDPYNENQLFVQQSLDAFLKMMKLIPKGINF